MGDDVDKVITQIATDFPSMDCMRLSLGTAEEGAAAVPSSAQALSAQQKKPPMDNISVGGAHAAALSPQLPKAPSSAGSGTSSSSDSVGLLLPTSPTDRRSKEEDPDVAVELLVQRFKELSDSPDGGQRAQFLARIQKLM